MTLWPWYNRVWSQIVALVPAGTGLVKKETVMSELSANGKSLILKDMVVTHNQMDDSIIITSNEPDIKGQP